MSNQSAIKRIQSTIFQYFYYLLLTPLFAMLFIHNNYQVSFSRKKIRFKVEFDLLEIILL